VRLVADETFSCQSTNLRKATLPIRAWDFRQYIWDISSGGFGPIERLHALLLPLSFKIIAMLGGQRHLTSQGKLKKTPVLTLNLQPGELVEVRTEEEILSTLDRKGRNKGLVFNAEMLKYCGRKLRVLRRVDKMINEKTIKMRRLSNTVILEGAMCDGKSHGGCQRNCYSLWREIWLKRVEPLARADESC
jgi:hypothetical protein